MRMRALVYAILLSVLPVSCVSADDIALVPQTRSDAAASASPCSLQAPAYELRKTPSLLEIADSRSACTESSPWRKAPVILTGTAVLFRYDRDIQLWAQQTRSPATDRLAAFAKPFGEPRTYARPMAGLLIYGILAGDDRARDTAIATAESLLIGGLVTQTIKYAVNRPRPGNIEEDDPFEGRSRLSFPSGHTTVAFAAATVVACEYGDNDIVPILAYAIASLTGWSRINDNAHWASDVLFGSYVGYLSAKGALSLTDEDDDGLAFSSLSTPLPLSLRFAF